MSDLLVVDKLSCGYGSAAVLRDVSMNVAAGEMVGVIGPNGSGKTTLLRAVTGALPCTRGSVRLAGRSVAAWPHRDRARIVAVLPQKLEIAFPFSVEEFIAMGRYPHGSSAAEDARVVEQTARLADVWQLRARKVIDLSGGETQRVLLAQALAQEPDLLLLDEPTSHLDVSHQIDILNRIKKLNGDEQLTIIAVMHDLNLCAEYFDRTVVLDGGQVFADGPSTEVLTYQNIEKVYHTVVVVQESPVTGRPHIFLVPEKHDAGA